jgi:hypothetical protein
VTRDELYAIAATFNKGRRRQDEGVFLNESGKRMAGRVLRFRAHVPNEAPLLRVKDHGQQGKGAIGRNQKYYSTIGQDSPIFYE